MKITTAQRQLTELRKNINCTGYVWLFEPMVQTHILRRDSCGQMTSRVIRVGRVCDYPCPPDYRLVIILLPVAITHNIIILVRAN